MPRDCFALFALLVQALARNAAVLHSAPPHPSRLPPPAAVPEDNGDAGVVVAAVTAATAPSVGTGACPTIYMTGMPRAHADSMGAYALQPGNATGGRPAYFDTTNGLWLYFYPTPGSSFNGWWISPNLGKYNFAYLVVGDTAQTPDAITATWLVYPSATPNGSSYQPAPSVKATCTPCPVITMAGTPPTHADLMRAYTLQPGNTTGGRPAYLNVDTGQWVYFYAPSGYWHTGPALGSDSPAYLIAGDTAQTPDAVTTEWEVWTDSWQPAPSIKVTCTPCTGGSTRLPAAQCAAWQAFYDALSGDGWTSCTGMRTDPCSCLGSGGNQPVCNTAGTAVVQV